MGFSLALHSCLPGKELPSKLGVITLVLSWLTELHCPLRKQIPLQLCSDALFPCFTREPSRQRTPLAFQVNFHLPGRELHLTRKSSDLYHPGRELYSKLSSHFLCTFQPGNSTQLSAYRFPCGCANALFTLHLYLPAGNSTMARTCMSVSRIGSRGWNVLAALSPSSFCDTFWMS